MIHSGANPGGDGGDISPPNNLVPSPPKFRPRHPPQNFSSILYGGSKAEFSEVESGFPYTGPYVYVTNGVIMVFTTHESSKINMMESPLQHDEIRPIQAANKSSS